MGLGGYYAYQRGIFASTETKESVGCTITLFGDIKKDANSDRFSLYFGPVDWEKNLTEIEILRSEKVIRNNKRTLRIDFNREKAFMTSFSRDPSNLTSGKYSFVDSPIFNCSAGKTFTVEADLRWATRSIKVTETGSGTTSNASEQPAVSTPESSTGQASTKAESDSKTSASSNGQKTTASGESTTNELEDNKTQENTASDSSSIGEVEITVETAEGKPVRSAKVTATTLKENNNRVELGDCDTNSEGSCQLDIPSSAANQKINQDDLIRYSAEKNEQSGTAIKLLQDSVGSGVQIEIKGLTEEEAAEYQDPSIAQNQEEFEIPAGEGFIGGNSSVTIIPTRFTRAGATASNSTKATAVGGVNFTLKIYYNKAGENSGSQGQYQTQTQAFAYTASNSLSSFFGGQQTKTFSGTIPDNGANSQLRILNLPAGDYLLTLEKPHFQSTNIKFSLSANEQKSAFLVNMRPTKGAEPPSISQRKEIRKNVDKDTYWAKINNVEYQYRPNYPWYGWQPESNYVVAEPSYSTDNNYIPQTESAPVTQGGYDTPWAMTANGLASYLNDCQTMNFGQGVDSEDAAVAAAIGGLGNWLFGDETKNLESFAETTLVPGLVTYFAAEAMEESGGSISLSTGNANCFPQSSSPYYNGYYTNQNQYGYPNGYSTSNIPSECLRCFTTPPIVYDQNWCPSYCQNYSNILGVSPLLNLALSALLSRN